MGEETQNFTLECSNEVFGTSLAKQFKKLFDKPLFSDIKIELSNGDVIQAHKFVLAVWCPMLLKEFSSQNVLRFDKADPSLVKLLVRFIYEGTAPISSEQLLPLIELAHMYDIEPVKDACGEALFERQKDVSFLLDISTKYKVKKLEVLCADHFADNLSQIRKESPEQLYKLHVNTWEALLKKDKLDIKSEQDVFELLMEYIKKRFPDPSPERDQAITKLLPQIRFVALRPEFVINEVEKNPILAHLPITSQLVFETYKYRALPEEYKKKMNFKSNTRGRSVTHLCWSVDHRHAQIVLSEDNLKATSSAQGIYQSVRTTSGVLPGSVGYFEVTLNAKNNWMVFGVCDSSFVTSNTNWPSSYTNNTWLYHHDYGTFWHNGTASGNRGQIPAIPVGGVVGVLIDHVGSKISFYLNGNQVGTAFTSIPNVELFGFITCHNLTVVTINDPPKYSP